MNFKELTDYIKVRLGDVIVAVDQSSSPGCIEAKKDGLLKLCHFLYKDEQLFFDSLSCITGLDNGPEADTLEVIYNFYSIPYDHHLMVKVTLGRVRPEIPSLTSIWKTADWLERETYDMYGIIFTDHPDLRRILLPADWEGYPLLKDYEEQELYRGVKVAYGEKEVPKDIPK